MAEIKRTEITDKDGVKYEVQFKPINNQDTGTRRRKKASRKGLLLIIVTTIIVVIVVAALLLTLQKDDPTVSTLKKIQKNTEYSLYYPTYIPATYTFDQADIVTQEGVLFITLRSNNGGGNLVISQQKKPDLNFESLFSVKDEQRPNAQITNAGTLYIGGSATENTATLVTPESWIIMNAPKDMDSSIFEELSKAFIPVRN